MSSAILGEVSNGLFRPAARIAPDAGTVAVRVEVHAASAAAFTSGGVRIEFVRVGETALVLTAPGQLAGASGPLRRAATTLVGIQDLPRGDYIIRVSLTSAEGTVIAQTSRLFRKE